MLSGDEISKHTTKDSCWIVINGNAYDVTDFLPQHPGGSKIILRYAGMDATSEYEPIHKPGTLDEHLPKDKHLGPVDLSTVKSVDDQAAPVQSGQDDSEQGVMTLAECLNLRDIERAAEQLLKPKAWAYYASAADDEYTKNWNISSWGSVRLRPRVLRNVIDCDTQTRVLGRQVSHPFFIAPCAAARLAHNDGELALARVAQRAGIPYIVSANASHRFEDIAQEAPDAFLMYQLYVNQERHKTEEILKRVSKAGYKAICVTVDAPVPGNRERDERAKLDPDALNDPSNRERSSDAPEPQTQSLATAFFSYVDATLSWHDIRWIKETSGGLPVALKGIQTVDDALMCAKWGADIIYLSNHGGRQLEGAPSSLETLVEIRKHAPHVLEQCEVWVDGGIRRGTDVIKALALGARAVGVGRPFMYSLVFGEAGPAKVAETLMKEVGTNMRLLGAQTVNDLKPHLVNTRTLEQQAYDGQIHVDGRAKL